ncbi:MAG: DUF131 domain-containing protein [Candidatus Verstraetearchaeota archaeon]|nr:DUF131 domain-containing protein [Candidatus Verstraetearchaeota archaeon]
MGYDPFALIFFGIYLIIVGLMLLALKSKGRVEGGALIMIGPIPIAIGTSTKIIKLLLLIGVMIFLIVVVI